MTTDKTQVDDGGASEESDGKRVRLQVMITPEQLAEIDDLAGRFGISRSRFASNLIEVAMSDNKWFLRFVRSRYFSPMMKVLERLEGKGRDDAD